uniref:Co-chaperonin GroES n=1 Tax=uncultured virus TaxID=340016 RepID=A0A221S4L6_9VIRU|nr:co-chaperonin GroES [uncultured virus]
MSNLEVVGHRVLIRPHLQEETSEGGIYLAVGKTFERERGATQIGTIVGIGPNAWLDFKSKNDQGELVAGTPWAKVGDVVYYAKYAGKDVTAGNDAKLVIVNDEDVQCIIHEVEESEDE